jgi:hypothetical protein
VRVLELAEAELGVGLGSVAGYHIEDGPGPDGAVGDRERRLQAAEAQPAVTEIVKIPKRGHSLTIDHGWREVAQTALDFVKRFA